jgi:hypothetical protein
MTTVLFPANLAHNATVLGKHYDGLVAGLSAPANCFHPGFWLDERLFLEPVFGNGGVSLVPDTPAVERMQAQAELRPAAGRRLFSDDEDEGAATLMSVGKASTHTRAQDLVSSSLGAARRDSYYGAFSNVLRSPNAPQPPATPVTKMLEETRWLTQRFGGSSAPRLSDDFRAALKDLVKGVLPDKIEANAQAAVVGLVLSDAPNCPRKASGLKAYYHVLERLHAAEMGRSKGHEWLTSKSFHNALLACCFQIVVFSYKVAALRFPAVLTHFGVSAWELLKVIESVVRHNPDLPRSTKAHLRDTEFSILERYSWVAGEPLRKFLGEAENRAILSGTALPSEIGAQRTSTSSPTMHASSPPSPNLSSLSQLSQLSQSSLPELAQVAQSSDAPIAFPLPNSAAVPALDTTATTNGAVLPTTFIDASAASSSPTSATAFPFASAVSIVNANRISNGSAQATAEASVTSLNSTTTSSSSSSSSTGKHKPQFKQGERFALELFSRKLLALAADRLEFLCEELGCESWLLDLVWALVHRILRVQMELMYDRHLDTILLCAIYAVCNKVARKDFSFKNIISIYTSRWYVSSEEVTRRIRGEGEEPVNVIKFYNEIFIQHVKHYISQVYFLSTL